MTSVYRYVFTIMPLVVCLMIAGSAMATAMPVMLIALPAGALVAWWVVRSMWPATRVIAVDNGLLVGDAERSILYSDIASVTQWIWNPELVTIRLHSGEEIRFFPQWRVRFGFGEHPVVDTLRARAALR